MDSLGGSGLIEKHGLLDFPHIVSMKDFKEQLTGHKVAFTFSYQRLRGGRMFDVFKDQVKFYNGYQYVRRQRPANTS